MKYIRLTLVALGLISSFAIAGVMPSVNAAPVDVFENSCDQAENANSELCKGEDQKLFGPNSIFTNIVNMIIYVIGAVAVVMIIIGGLRYTLSAGDQSAITSAKNTILYSVVGLVIAVMSYAIVNFVIINF